MTSAAPNARPRRILMLPGIFWLPARARYRAGEEPEPFALDRSLARLGIETDTLDPMRRPWNPLAGRHQLLQGLDLLRTLRVLLFRRNVDAVVCVFEGPAVLLCLLRRVFRFKPRVLMWDLNITGGWRLRDAMLDRVVPGVDGILTLGSNQAEGIAARWSHHAPVTCIGHAVDAEFWHPVPPAADPAPGYILSVGDDAGRDYPTLLAAVAGLDRPVVIRSGQDLRLDPARDARVRQERSRLPFPRLRELYAGAAVVVVPARDVPSASGVSALLEAAAVGCPLVVSNSAGLRDWLRDGETCLVVPCGDAAAMAVAIRRLLDDPALARRLGAAARAFVLRECTTDAVAARLAGVVWPGEGVAVPLHSHPGMDVASP